MGYSLCFADSRFSEFHSSLSFACVFNVVWFIYLSTEIFDCIIFTIDFLELFIEHSSLTLAVKSWLQLEIAVFRVFVKHLMLGSIINGLCLVSIFQLSFSTFQFTELALNSILIQQMNQFILF